MKGKLTREQTLFRRTRLQLTAWYVGVMGATVVASGILLYHCLAVAERWWLDRSIQIWQTLPAAELIETSTPLERDPDLEIVAMVARSEAHLRGVVWILVFSTPLVVVGVAVAGYGLSGVAMDPIARSYERMRRFTGDAAHELRTPLATSRTLIHQAQRGQGIPEDLIEGMAKQNQRLSQLVADLLLLSRLDEGAEVPTQRCCLNDVLSDVTEELGSLAQGLRLRLELPAENVWVEGIEEQLYRLMINLMTNGIQYTPQGGSVTVYLKEMGQQAVIEVRDTGVGIPEAQISRIFERFYRVDEARDRRTGGTGLGLAIVRAIVQQHQGGIRVQSHLGQGSCFIVTLPRVMAGAIPNPHD